MARDIRTVVSGMHFLEGPRWHDGRIWFSDFYSFQVYSAREDGSDLRVEARVEHKPSGIGWLPDGRLLVVSMRDRKLLLHTHASEQVAEVEVNPLLVKPEGQGVRMLDALVIPA